MGYLRIVRCIAWPTCHSMAMAMRLIFPATATANNHGIVPMCPPANNHGIAPMRPPANLISSKPSRRGRSSICPAVSDKEGSNSVEQVTKKYGLEAGLWKIFTTKDDENGENGKEMKKNQAKQLLARYGGAYLATSISLSVVSFTVCYLLINAGVDVQSLLDKVGIHTDETGEKVGTFALAYAAHKAASPVRFPPTVALTPIVAGWFGKKSKDKEENQIT